MCEIKNRLRIGVLLTLLVGVLSNSLAQESEFARPGFSYGARAGLAVLSFGNNMPYTAEKSGFYVGGIVEYAPNSWLSILAKPGYAQYGGRTEDFTDESIFFPRQIDSEPISEEPPVPEEIASLNPRLYTTVSTITTHSIELPLMARYGYDLENIRLFAGLGISINYQVFVSEFLERTYFANPHADTFPGTFISTSGYNDATRNYQPFQAGAIIELGTLFKSGDESRIAVNLSYQHGLTPLKKSFSHLNLAVVAGDLTANRFSLGIEFMF